MKKMTIMDTRSMETGSMGMSSSSARRHGMVRRIMELTLAGYKWEVVGGTISWGWSGWGSGRAGGHCNSPPVVLL